MVQGLRTYIVEYGPRRFGAIPAIKLRWSIVDKSALEYVGLIVIPSEVRKVTGFSFKVSGWELPTDVSPSSVFCLLSNVIFCKFFLLIFQSLLFRGFRQSLLNNRLNQGLYWIFLNERIQFQFVLHFIRRVRVFVRSQ